LTRFAYFCDGLMSLGKAIMSSDSLARKRVRQQASVFLMSTGVSLMLLTAGAYHWMHQEQQRLISQQRLHIIGTSASGGARADITLLSIPKIDLEAAILETTSKKSLLLAPAHLEKTAWPGETGNSVVAGHRDTFFRRLNELQNGDDVLVTRGQRQYHYVVSNKSIVSPSDISVTMPTSDSRLTLVTCYPTYYIGPAPKRLIVVATLQQSGPGSPFQGLTIARTSHSMQTTP
jgi:LPXTG-site transpeptidase (sortase) family protein